MRAHSMLEKADMGPEYTPSSKPGPSRSISPGLPSGVSDPELEELKQVLTMQLPMVTELLYRLPIHRHAAERVSHYFTSVVRVLALALNSPLVQYHIDGGIHLLRLLVASDVLPQEYLPPKLNESEAPPPSQQANGPPSLNFYQDHGRPIVRRFDERDAYYWPDDTSPAARTCLRLEGHDMTSWRCEVQGRGFELGSTGCERSWVSCMVRGRAEGPPVGEAPAYRYLLEAPDGAEVSLDLALFDVRWLGSERDPSAAAPGFKPSATGARLRFAAADEGVRISVWWQRYRTYYAGTIISFDEETSMHTVHYDDDEVKIYDMKTKQYIVLGGSTSNSGSGSSEAVTANGKGELHRGSPSYEWSPRPSPPGSLNTSIYHLNNINAFAAAGGFTRLVRRLSYLDMSFKEVQGVVTVLADGLGQASSRHATPLIWAAKEAAPRALLQVKGDKLKGVGYSDLLACVMMIKNLVSSVTTQGDDPGAAERLETAAAQLRLGIAGNLFESSQLEKRLLGLMHIKGLVEAASKGDPASWAHAGFLEGWLKARGVVEELLGPGMHVELLGRARGILLFLANRNVLTTSQLEMLWSCSVGKHETVTRVVYREIVELVPHLSPYLRLYLFRCMARLPYHKYTEQSVQLLYDYTVTTLDAQRDGGINSEHASGSGSGGGEEGPGGHSTSKQQEGIRKGQVVHSPERDWLAYGLLWKFVQDGGNTVHELASPALAEKAADLLVQLLRQPEIMPDRAELIERCMENLHQHRSVAISLTILRKALSTLPNQSKGWFDKMTSRGRDHSLEGVLEAVERGHSLIESFMTELVAFNRYIHSYYLSKNIPKVERRINTAPVRVFGIPTRFSHLEHLRARLEFLLFILNSSSLALNEEQVKSSSMNRVGGTAALTFLIIFCFETSHFEELSNMTQIRGTAALL
ncbi:unnamed protein product, partial [Chrysoparadoxa australica]